MATPLTVEYDSEADTLYLGRMTPYPEQETEELEYGVVARLNPTDGKVENVEILFFLRRLTSGAPLELPVLAEFDLPHSA